MKINQQVSVVDNPNHTINDIVQEISKSHFTDEPFYIMDVSDIIRKYDIWMETFPNIKPFYAVKCNDSPLLLKVLASLGVCFDCASKGEINQVLGMEAVSPERIVFANPAKQASHIKHAARVGVDLMVFDNSTELYKIHQYHPTAKLLLRIRVEAAARCPLNIKFGCDPNRAPELLKTAAMLNLNVVGVSFHVGSDCFEAEAYSRAIASARNVFDQGWEIGFSMNILDIGGGFSGEDHAAFIEVSKVINNSLLDEFEDIEGLEVIAEPGRFFAASAYTLVTTIHSKREVEGKKTMYYINDGVYGSFNCILYDHAAPTPFPLKSKSKVGEECSIWGPTCDSLDVVCENIVLPPLEIGDLLLFSNMGAYTLPVASTFNGYPLPSVYYIVQHKYSKLLKSLVPGIYLSLKNTTENIQ